MPKFNFALWLFPCLSLLAWGSVYSIVTAARTGNNQDLMPQLTVLAVVAGAAGVAAWFASPAPRTGYFLGSSTKTLAVTGLIVLGVGLPRLVLSHEPGWDLALSLVVTVVLGILAVFCCAGASAGRFRIRPRDSDTGSLQHAGSAGEHHDRLVGR